MKTTTWVLLGLALLVIGLAALFTVQNSSRVTDLSLDLWITAFHMKEEVPVPYLLWGAFGGGLLIGGGWGVLGRLGGGRSRASSSEPRFSRADVGRVDDDWT